MKDSDAGSCGSPPSSPADATVNSKIRNGLERFDAGDDVRSGPSTSSCLPRRWTRAWTAAAFLAVLCALLAVLLLTTLIRFRRLSICSGDGSDPSSQLPLGSVNSNGSGSSLAAVDAFPDHLSLPWNHVRLPGSVRPVSYVLRLDVDPLRTFFRGTAVIEFQVLEETDFIVVHAAALDFGGFDGVRVLQGLTRVREIPLRRVTPVLVNEFLILELSERLSVGSGYRLDFGEYRGVMADELRGLYRSTYRDEHGQQRFLSSSQLQSTDARRVFPCFDEPSLKATFTVTIIHPPGYRALSNMPLNKSAEVLETADSLEGSSHVTWIEDSFQQTPVVSTYLLAFVVADFRHRETTAVGGLKIRIWSRPIVFNQTAYALELAAKAYNFYTGYFNISEVVPKADHAGIPDFSAGAMENWGLVLYRESTLLHDETVSPISNKYWVSLVMAHEIAHTWFGNMVTMAWWDDLWLNEGFANTLMYFALDSIYPSWKVFDLQLVTNIYPVMTKDALLTSHPISANIENPDEITLFFDSISYDKGMAVLRLLRGFLGWDGFREGLKRYITKFKFSNAKMSELWDTFETATGSKLNITVVMDTWTRQMGFPVVTVRHVTGTRYVLNQTRFLVNPDDRCDPSESIFGYKWKIPFIYKVQGEQLERTQWLDMGPAFIDLPASASDAWLIGNLNYVGFFRTNYDQQMWHRITDQLLSDHTVFSAANRAGLISDAFNLARANQLSYDVAFKLTSYLHKELDYVPWAAFFDSMDFIDGMLSNSDSYGLLQNYIRSLVGPQYRRLATVKSREDLLDRNLRSSVLAIACAVQVPEAVSWARQTFTSWMINSSRVEPDFAAVVYSTGIQYGAQSEWDFVWNKTQSTVVVSEAETMMTALARTQQPWLLWRYVRMSLDSTKVRTQDIRNLFRFYTSTPLGRLVTLQFMLNNWQEINSRFGSDPFLLRDVIFATTNFVNTEYDYQLLARLYSESSTPTTATVDKTAANSLAVVRSNINWMKLHYGSITSWLKVNG